MLQLVHSHLSTDAPTPKRVVKSRYEQNAEKWNEESWNKIMSSEIAKDLADLEKLIPGSTARLKKETQFI